MASKAFIGAPRGGLWSAIKELQKLQSTVAERVRATQADKLIYINKINRANLEPAETFTIFSVVVCTVVCLQAE
jgi:hypothetical protein